MTVIDAIHRSINEYVARHDVKPTRVELAGSEWDRHVAGMGNTWVTSSGDWEPCSIGGVPIVKAKEHRA